MPNRNGCPFFLWEKGGDEGLNLPSPLGRRAGDEGLIAAKTLPRFFILRFATNNWKKENRFLHYRAKAPHPNPVHPAGEGDYCGKYSRQR